MNRKVRRQLERLSQEDNCSICGQPFPHLGSTYGGTTPSGAVELVGECCRSKLKKSYDVGIYIHPFYMMESSTQH
jgi:hypothetical protein